jgi:hypothetical protein
MIPVGYKPIRITRTEPTLSRWHLVAWLALALLALNIAEIYFPSL